MKAIWNLTRANLYKAKGQAFAFGMMIFLAALLLHLGLITYFNYGSYFDRTAVEQNSGQALFAMQSRDEENIQSFIAELKGDLATKDMEASNILYSLAGFEYGDGKQMQPLAILPIDDQQKMDKVELLDERKEVENPVYLPYLFSSGGNYDLGDAFEITLGNQKVVYHVAGFYENVFLASTNIGLTSIALDKTEYEELQQMFPALQGTIVRVSLDDETDNAEFTTKHFASLSTKLSKDIQKDAAYFDLVKQARTLTSSIGSMIITTFSFIVVMIGLVVVYFRVRNTIEEDMTNIGALKAMGYTSIQIILSLILQFVSIGIVFSILGIAFSYVLLPLLAEAYCAQTGVIWHQGFDILVASNVFLIMLVSVVATVLFSARKIRHLQPIVALRYGLTAHSFKRNYFPLSKKGKLSYVLGFKMMMQNMYQNILVFVITTCITFAMVFAGAMYYNIVLDESMLVNAVMGEVTDIRLILNRPANNTDLNKIQELKQVTKSMYYQQENGYSDGHASLMYVTDNFDSIQNQDMIYQGRFPKHTNEIAVNGYMAEVQHKDIGDEICISVDNIEKTFLITGLLQSGNFMGYDVALTTSAFRNFHPTYKQNTIHVYVTEKENTKDVIQQLENTFTNDIDTVVDMNQLASSQLGIYTMVVTVMAIIIAFITLLLVALVLYLIIKTLLIKKKRELGIQKAIGFTTKELIMQYTLSLLPTIVLATITGSILGYYCMNPLTGLMFQGMGMMHMNFTISPSLLVGVSVIISIFAIFITLLLCRRIKHISAYALIIE